MNPLKKLAGQTALYGVSSILGRVLNYALVPLHTQVFENTAQFGGLTELYSYVAFLNIVYTLGMETAYFRFVSRSGDADEQQRIYNVAFTSVFAISLLLSCLIGFNAEGVAGFLGYEGRGNIISWLAAILLTDAIVAIPYARLRIENKALMFAVTRISAIVLTVLLNLFFLLLLPKIHTASPILEAMYNPDLGIGYVFLANLIGNAIIPVILWKYLLEVKLSIDWRLFKPMMVYAFPILVMGLAGMANENVEKILLPELLPDNFYPGQDPQQALGVYGACFKLSIFMMLAIQAFRYAGEPFFFSKSEDKTAPGLFATVMHYFNVLSILILVGVSLNLELVGSIFIRNPQYREALWIVPFLLVAKLFYGIYLNLTVWFKLSDKTHYGTIFSIIGALITIGGNILLIPVLGYFGCALASIACYVIMSAICYYYGQQYYPIPYNFKPTFLYLLVSVGLIFLTFRFSAPTFTGRVLVNLAVTILFVAAVFFIEKRSFALHKV